MNLTHKGTITLETERLILRRFILEDAEAIFHNWANDSDVTKYLMWQPHGNIEATQKVLTDWVNEYEKSDYYQWAIVPKDVGEPIGSIAAVHSDDSIKMVHIGYCIGKAWWRQGYTSEALAALIHFFFEEVGVNRIESRHDPRNPHSGAVMMKCDLQYEGTLRQSDTNNQGGLCNASYYAILAEDYFAPKIISVRDNPQYYERAVDYFSTKWGIDRKIYEESITDAIKTGKPLPRWYLMLCGNNIIGSYGLIENDFMVRKDLKPWLCALYVEEDERGKALGAKSLDHARQECGKLGFDKLYLCTDHVGYYEKYGWIFFGMEESEFGGTTRVYSTDAIRKNAYQFTDICFISDDVLSLIKFYETVFGVKAAEDGNKVHSGISVGGLNISIDSSKLTENTAFHYVSGQSSDNTIAGFNVDDVDTEYARLLSLGVTMLNEPTTHPWGARSFQFKDPDGNILNFRSFVKE